MLGLLPRRPPAAHRLPLLLLGLAAFSARSLRASLRRLDGIRSHDDYGASVPAAAEEGPRRDDGVVRRRGQGVTKVYLLPRAAPDPHAPGEYGHFILDAVRRSARLRATDDPDDPDAAWVVDTLHTKCNHRKRGAGFLKLVNESLARRTAARRPAPGVVPGWDVYMIDFTDSGYTRVSHHDRITRLGVELPS